MKYILFLSSLFFCDAVIAQNSQIIITVKIVNGDFKFDTSYKDKRGNFITEDSKIKDAFKDGGKIVFQSDQNAPKVTFQLKKDNGFSGEKNLNDALLSLQVDISFTFDKTGKIEKNPLIIKNDSTPDVSMHNLIICFSDSLVANPKEIRMSQVSTKILTNYGHVTNSANTNNPCDSCFTKKYVNEVKNGNVIIYYDFSCKCFYKLNKKGEKKLVTVSNLGLFRKKEIRLVVENVNRYIYDVTVTNRTVKYESEMPALFKNFFFSDSSTLLSALVTSVPQSSKAADSTVDSSLNAKFNLLEVRLREFHDKLNSYEAKKLSAYLLCTKFDCCESSSFISEFEELLNSLSNLKSEANELKLEIAKGDSKEIISQNIATLKSDLIECIEQDKGSSKIRKEKEKELDKEKANQKPDAEKIKKLKAEIDKAIADTCKNKVDIKSSLNTENERLVLIKIIDSFQVSLPTKDEISQLYLFVKNMIKINGESVQAPIAIKGNVMEFSIQIKPNDSSLIKKWNITPLYNDSFGIKIPVLMKPFVSFSSGSFIGLGRNLINKTYGWQSLPASNNVLDTNRNVLTENGYTSLPMGFAAFINVEFKPLSWIAFGPSIGVGLTIEKKARMSYLAGGSLFFGEKKQLAVSIGFVAMNVDKLNNNFKAIYDQQIIYKKPVPIEYYKELKTGGFVSLTYTLFTENKTTN